MNRCAPCRLQNNQSKAFCAKAGVAHILQSSPRPECCDLCRATRSIAALVVTFYANLYNDPDSNPYRNLRQMRGFVNPHCVPVHGRSPVWSLLAVISSDAGSRANTDVHFTDLLADVTYLTTDRPSHRSTYSVMHSYIYLLTDLLTH